MDTIDFEKMIKDSDGVVMITLVDGEIYLSHTNEFDDHSLLDLLALCTNVLYNQTDSDIKRQPLQ